MDQQSITTPSATSSRDATIEASSYEPSSPVVISSSASESDEFKPHQMLMQTPITVEYGPTLSDKLTMHEELLCCYSSLLEERFARAKALRQKYEQANALRDQIATCIFPEVTVDEFEVRDYQEKALPLIMSAYENYPLPPYAKFVRAKIDEETEKQVQSKNVKAQKLHAAIREEDLKVRIKYIDATGVYSITEALFGLLHRINKKEAAGAEGDVKRAAAQKRILLPGVEKKTVELVMQWVYQGKFECQQPEQLYNTLQLATQLGIEALSELCLTRLYNAANDSIQNASVTGVSLKSLLGYGPGPSDQFVGVIFKHALQDHNTPKRLQELVVNTLAIDLDKELWEDLKDLASHTIALEVIDAMLKHREQIVEGIPDHDFIKFEDEQAHTESPAQLKDE